mmetsp:Transcript_17582/g.27171  ORF Transcript_17582/g.27171 Transcript_17582/m.27171 type:complete len:145 (-) Transcript_17582:78-512(-)|eukprot:CAMPEP_0117027592 /NCGR_PEP_ID=MMETSP0472-20121206/20153_1 /TAXON_ID=693140 ORGANISM="Tiarina fusus, Strain LIS" /NCGR_SAMPLE_ID=MMETSP0472 /ASSEMBLY_ACC=CAM_ASM_000603 /LENGTH=144 /DNA_ID=CAMNT_0004734877 /DNA_START=224 /DNA_END=658 /DNA_ORIENTATION=+
MSYLQFRLWKQCLATTRAKPGAVAGFWSTTTSNTTTDPPYGTRSASSTKKTVSKRDIVAEIAETHELSLAKSERILNTVLDTIVEGVSDDHVIRLAKFGTFEAVEAKARQGRNPGTGQPLFIPAKNRVRFRPFTDFKKSANEKF